MIQRDFIMRLVHQLAQALATVLAHKRGGGDGDVEQLLSDALTESVGVTIEQLRAADRAALFDLCSYGDEFSGELGVAVASLLAEDDHPASRERALWLYEETATASGIVPFDIHERISLLRDELDGRSAHGGSG